MSHDPTAAELAKIMGVKLGELPQAGPAPLSQARAAAIPDDDEEKAVVVLELCLACVRSLTPTEPNQKSQLCPRCQKKGVKPAPPRPGV